MLEKQYFCDRIRSECGGGGGGVDLYVYNNVFFHAWSVGKITMSQKKRCSVRQRERRAVLE